MTNSTLNKLYNNIKVFRKNKGYSQEKLAEKTGISVDYISLIECGKRTPSVKTIIKISEILEIDVYKFFM